MLKPEAAKQQLEQWEVHEQDVGADADERSVLKVATLPKPLRAAGYAFFDRDADGKNFSDRDRDQQERRKNAAFAEFDALPAAERMRFFGLFFPKLAEQVEQGWQLLKRVPYPHGYDRKAFRAPRHPAKTLHNRLDWFGLLHVIVEQYRAEAVTCAWLAAWAPHLSRHYSGFQDPIGRLLAAVIDAGGPLGDEVFDILAQSARNEHEIGGMGRHVTRGLLLASRPDGWELMEKTLIAAQRQEGLRQAILETIDEAHPQAFRRMLRLIMEHDLARFSAVVRAVNVWFGFAWDSVSVKVVNDTIEKALRYLDDEAACQRALKGKSAEDVFLALWSLAFEDAPAAIPVAAKFLKHAKVEHRYVAVLHLTQLGLTETQAARLPALEDTDFRVVCCALSGLSAGEEEEPDELKAEGDLFERLERLYARMPPKPTLMKALVWPWTATRADRGNVAGHLYHALGDREPTRLLPYLAGFSSYVRARIVELLANQKKWDKLTRDSLLGLAGDNSSEVRQAAYGALVKGSWQPGDAERLEGYLTRKSSDLRRGCIRLLAGQSDAVALASADRLLAAKDANQRLAGLEVLRQLAEAGREREACQTRTRSYQASRKQVTKEEQTQLTAILDTGTEKLTLDNALGLMNPAERTPVVPPKKRDVLFMTEAAVSCLKSLDQFIHEHREEMVTIKAYDGKTEQKLLGTVEWGFPSPEWQKPPERCKTALPQRELWEQWRDQRPKDLRDTDGLELVRASAWAELSRWSWKGSAWESWAKRSPVHRQVVRILSGGKEPIPLRYQSLTYDVLQWLTYLDPPKKAVETLLDAVETSFALVPPDFHNRLVELAKARTDDVDEDNDKAEPDWRNAEPLEFWLETLQSCMNLAGCRATQEQWVRYWQLMHWRDEPLPGASRSRPSNDILREAYAAGAATKADWYDQVLGPRLLTRWGGGWAFGELNSLTGINKENEVLLERCPEIRTLVDRCRERILETELARGEEQTLATRPALELGSLHGVDTLLRILTALGKQGLRIESRWNESRRVGRTATLTHLASITYPKPDDSPGDFAAMMRAAVDAGHIPEARVLELAFLAPQWARFIEAFLNWPGCTEGLYWFLAHMKYIGSTGEQAAAGAGVTAETATNEQNDENSWNQPSAWNRLIMERTPLTDEERSAGAVDVGWFQRTYAQLTPKRWEAMAAAARFAATPAQAKRAQFIADVLLGKASRKELIAGIRKQNLKENVRLLGLFPLATGPKRDADLAERYKVLQDYRRYAKQLSAMSKEDAVRSADVGMQNLARTAGYADPLRLEWAMEADSVKDLARGPISATRDGVTVSLGLDDAARPELTVRRGDKELKSIPPELKKKDKAVARLAERVTELKRQSSRMRQSLEIAMCRGDSFSGAELAQLCEHAILAPQLTRLVLIGDGIMGYPDKKGKALRDHRGKLEPVKKTESLRIAHPHDLFASKHWDTWQHECFRGERVQPFKQVFRELYLVTKQEKADQTLSHRYAGQQVNEQQALALWGQRGWNTKEGVWKTFYDLGITAAVGFTFGITTPLEVEGLTIEAVRFSRRDAVDALKLPDVPPRLFSEVMRDLDLVVSVAHRGGVDPEASASTVEMRATLLRETSQLLQLKNVRLKEPYALVDGELGKYSVHLGSAVVHKMPGGALCIVPVHAQHRGRLFLPFADDDPKTAEVVSKVLLLARDHEILDPTILDQLRHLGV